MGFIGTNNISDSSYRGIVFDLNYAGNYMAWACDSDNDGDFNWKWVYTRNATSGYAANRLHALVPIDMHGQDIINARVISTDYRIQGVYYSNSGIRGRSGTINIDGMIITVEDGLIVKVHKGTAPKTTTQNYFGWSYSI